MNIAIDISQIAYEGTGVGRFVEGLTRSILTFDTENKWTFLYSSLRQHLDPEIRNLIAAKKQAIREYKLPPTALAFIWNTVHRMKAEKLVGRQDWLITSDWTEPPSRLPKATIIHDLAFIRYPETVHPKIRQTQAERIAWVKKESRVIFADSQATKQDIIELLTIPENRITVNYPGVRAATVSESDIQAAKQKFGLAKPFILTVGKIEPRKNLGRLLEAFRNIRNDDIDLVVVGQQGWDTETSREQSAAKNIKFLGFISETDLASLYRSCLFFVYPSLYEGFGYPVVEAMQSGAAVATSSTSSLKELGADAALLFNPKDTAAIRDALVLLVKDEKIRENYAKKGIMKSREFTWERYYNTMLSALHL